MSTGWSLFVVTLVAINIVGCAWLLFANRHVQVDPRDKGEATGHDFDGIEELNNPLPAWWTWLFIATIVFGVGYFVLYPSFGNIQGLLGWSSEGELAAEAARAEERFGPIFASYLAQEIPALGDDERANRMGRRIFANRCSVCHGSDARGGPGYPNLTDSDWLYGGDPKTIVDTITNGRNGVMPPLEAAIGGEVGTRNVTQYVLSLSGRDHDATAAAAGKPMYDALCAACHGREGRGMTALGSPDMTDDVWLHGGRASDIERAIREGIVSQMPAHDDILSPAHIHLVAAYVYNLSEQAGKGGD